MSDCYVVLDGTRVVMASMSLQGAENIRADEARRIADARWPEPRPGLPWKAEYATAYDRMRIVNTELEDE